MAISLSLLFLMLLWEHVEFESQLRLLHLDLLLKVKTLFRAQSDQFLTLLGKSYKFGHHPYKLTNIWLKMSRKQITYFCVLSNRRAKL